jgi:hypothetical protein
MANAPNLFRAKGRLDELVVHIRSWSFGVVDEIGSDPRSSDVEDSSLGILGPQQAAGCRPRRAVSVTAQATEFSADEIAEPVASEPGCRRWLEMERSTRGHAEPIHLLIGRSSLIDQAGGEVRRSYHLREETAWTPRTI